ncbi:6024_t:CDS:2 [Ambispora gerdemannii]|uniref:6024_t:CDS:1 n=1 Tax=Ambispora gerdemannii TaxID=144530 RepID=A0A9N9G924_9GLOM|nr:6024_t:CDS:2 [Ambispora gerdemannii]
MSNNMIKEDFEYNVTGIQRVRPSLLDRKFTSPVIEDVIESMKLRMKDKDLAVLFENCWSNTLDSAIAWHGKSNAYPRTFVVPGNIGIMFIRDSTNQMIPYTPFAKHDPKLKDLILGVILMQAEFLASDPYANSFYPPLDSNLPRPENPWSDNDKTTPLPSSSVWQSKWGADNLAFFLKLTYHYWKNTNDTSFLKNANWSQAAELSVKVFTEQRRATMEEFGHEAYKFTRKTRTASETLLLNGIVLHEEQILTSTQDQEILENLDILKNISLETGLISQAVWYNDPKIVSQPWFASANSLFGEAILRLAEEKPHLIFDMKIESTPNFGLSQILLVLAIFFMLAFCYIRCLCCRRRRKPVPEAHPPSVPNEEVSYQQINNIERV